MHKIPLFNFLHFSHLLEAGGFCSFEHLPLLERLHGVDPVGVSEFDDGHFAESASPDDLERLEVLLAQTELLDLDEDGLGVLQKVRYRLFSPEMAVVGRVKKVKNVLERNGQTKRHSIPTL